MGPWRFVPIERRGWEALSGVRLGRWRLLMMVSVAFMGLFIAFVTLSPATLVGLVKPALHLGIGTFMALVILLMTLLMAPFVVVPQIYLSRALSPLLAVAPRTNERIKMRDQLPKIATSVSSTLLVVGLISGLCMMAGTILMLLESFFEGRLARDLLLVSPLFVIGGLLTAYFVYLMRLKAKLKRAAA